MMATTNGTAANYNDLMARLVTFLTGASLGAQAWTALRNVTGEAILRGPGLTGTDQIFIGMKSFSDVSADYYNWVLSGFTGFDAGLPFEGQPGAHHTGWGASQSGPILTLQNAAIPYWMGATGRWVWVVAKVGTVYVSCVAGFALTPFASPGQWPYPMVLGANMAWPGELSLAGNTNLRWSYAGTQNRNWFNSGSGLGREGQLRVRLNDGTWWSFGPNYSAREGTIYPIGNGNSDLRPNLDGTYQRLPLILSRATETGEKDVLGQFDQVNWVPGFGNAAENTHPDGSDTWLAVPNVFRATKTDYAAFKLA
ncbi:hypothetical protein [Geothrix sp. PMB-07]|uniref:hypothetical protein n=1 Tax=Geothrix sp. PMB-07 TaxID=3068640 RepID=UPI002741C32C|nr:hypothetical protein [Geothrix sp. PMB-07]WLT32266.1 hypothetical protein Q9293_02825 [Geothrix sp. PMB-07]